MVANSGPRVGIERDGSARAADFHNTNQHLSGQNETGRNGHQQISSAAPSSAQRTFRGCKEIYLVWPLSCVTVRDPKRWDDRWFGASKRESYNDINGVGRTPPQGVRNPRYGRPSAHRQCEVHTWARPIGRPWQIRVGCPHFSESTDTASARRSFDVVGVPAAPRCAGAETLPAGDPQFFSVSRRRLKNSPGTPLFVRRFTARKPSCGTLGACCTTQPQILTLS